MSVYLAFAALVAVVLRSAAMGMAVAIAGWFGESIIVALLASSSGWLSEAAKYTIGYNTNNLLALNALSPLGELEPWWRVTIILTVYVAVFLGAAYFFFRRQDLTA
jgi:ABC-type transport system involved in multi-copper enzyme maturation permease subunit